MNSLNKKLSPETMLRKIRGDFVIEEEDFKKLANQIESTVSQTPVLADVQNLNFLKYINHPQIGWIKRTGFLSPELIFFSDKIKSLCRLTYLHKDGRIDPCGGIRKNYLACSQYSPDESLMKEILKAGSAFCFLQADGLTDMKQQKYLHEILLQFEEYLRQNGISIAMSFSAGPCRICETCAGEIGEDCYDPERKRFSLESFGIDVDWAMQMMARKTNDDVWKLRWINNFGLENQDNRIFKSVLGLLIC